MKPITAKTQSVHDNPANPSRFKLGYRYANGALTGISYPSGLQVQYVRDASGRISGINTQVPTRVPGRGQAATAFVAELTHTALGQPRSWRWSNGDEARRNFDADGRISGITQKLWARQSDDDAPAALIQTPLSWTASYDSRNRLIGFSRAGAQASYGYDANSNRLSALEQTRGNMDSDDTERDGAFDEDERTQTVSQALNIDAASNRLLGFTQTITSAGPGQDSRNSRSASASVAYALDANGNLTSERPRVSWRPVGLS